MRRLLLVENPSTFHQTLTSALPSENFTVLTAKSCAEATLALKDNPLLELLVMTETLPDGLGLRLVKSWSDAGILRGLPVIMVGQTEDVDFKVSAFALGIEDYISPSIHPRELRARIELRLHRAEQRRSTVEVLQKGSLLLNFPLMRATLIEDAKEIPVEFTAKEFRLVATMAAHEGQIFTRAQLVKEIWGEQMHIVNRTVDSHICGARRKMGPAGDYIQSVTGAGYRFLVKD